MDKTKDFEYMKKILKYLSNKVIYEELNLKEIEKKLLDAKIIPKRITSVDGLAIISNYFFLWNDVNIDRLNLFEKDKLINLYKDYIDSGKKEDKDLCLFLKERLYKLLLPNSDEDYPMEVLVRKSQKIENDSIILMCHFVQFDNDYPMTNQQYAIMHDLLEKVEQDSISKGLKVKIVEFNDALIMREI